MNHGINQELKFVPKETEDYGMVSGLAGMMFYGNSRNDAYNENLDGGSPTDSLPCQSMVIATRVTA